MNSAAQTPQNTRIYAIGDIHGRLDLLCELEAEIAKDRHDGAPERAVIVYLGDYVDRGPSSNGVISHLIKGPPPGFEAVYLKGNHEDMMLQFLETGALGESWIMNGGGPTLDSYGIPGGRNTFDALWNLEELRKEMATAISSTHLDFLRHLKIRHMEGNYAFVHAGFRPGIPLQAQTEQDQIWIRGEFLNSTENFGHVVVHGHTPKPTPVVRTNRIGIDTMAFRTGCLTCLVLDGAERRFIST